MSHGTLDYQSPGKESHGWRTGDTILLVCMFAYAAFNVVLMLMYANNMLGPVPFDLIFLFLGISTLGVIATFPAQFALRRVGVTWRSAVAVIICFGALAAFNFWCLYAASAAV
jgi:hypothetical protein